MIIEDYVSFRTSKLLKEKGFNEPCLMCYTSDKKLGNYGHYNSYKNSEVFSLTAPTIQMTMKWLREVHNISVEPFVDFGGGDEHWWTADVAYIKKDGLIDELCGYNSYEEACEAGIKYCLENLI